MGGLDGSKLKGFNGCCPNILNLFANIAKIVRDFNEYVGRVIKRPTPIKNSAPTS